MNCKEARSDLAKLSLRELLKLRAKLRARVGQRQVDSFLSEGVMTSNPHLSQRLRAVNEEIERRGSELQREATRRLLADYKANSVQETAEVSHVQNKNKAAGDAESEPTDAASGKTQRATIGANIERFRKECGWSLDVLTRKTGIDKKAILSHVHGRSKPNPRTLKEYAQAFSKELQEKITVNDLENRP